MQPPEQITPDLWLSIRCAAPVVHELLAHAHSTPAEEICGVLLGDSASHTVRASWRGHNLALDRRRHFLLDPATLLQADHAARAQGWAILGFYHSHPAQLPVPSPADCATMWPQAVHIILGSHSGQAVLCAWQQHAGRLFPCVIQIKEAD